MRKKRVSLKVNTLYTLQGESLGTRQIYPATFITHTEWKTLPLYQLWFVPVSPETRPRSDVGTPPLLGQGNRVWNRVNYVCLERGCDAGEAEVGGEAGVLVFFNPLRVSLCG